MAARCNFWLPKKKRFCSNVLLRDSQFCGNHTQRSDGQWVPCPIHPSHSVLEENLQSHLKRCPFFKQAQSLSIQPFYQEGINAGKEEEEGGQNFSSEMKRNAVHGMTLFEFSQLINKIKSIHASICSDIGDSFKIPQACDIWTNRQVDRCSTIVLFRVCHFKRNM
ncbi:tRNA:m(4)X modification enzyme TRM13 homolog [Solanum tuberosum]|uniref:tRNA:m(4)X modification enzyme TRM13 homolog n=1 Tax=Solanum tuberosum TaxID=4113 RepID=UPI00073A5097|nr:PREDICTED: tRNA:m(4)X modification enzyme TRM13 homolog [Solanum tuberosum]